MVKIWSAFWRRTCIDLNHFLREIRDELENTGIIFEEGVETNIVYKDGNITVLDYVYNVNNW